METKIAVGTGPYREMIATSLAADEGYDVAMMNPTDFPSMVREALQPMNDIATFNADDPAWDKQIMNAYAVGGKYYGVNIRGNWRTIAWQWYTIRPCSRIAESKRRAIIGKKTIGTGIPSWRQPRL